MEGGSAMVAPLDSKSLRFSRRALQVFGLVFTMRERKWAGSPYPITELATSPCSFIDSYELVKRR